MDRRGSPGWSRVALLTIDVQNDFALPDAPARIEGTLAAAPRMARLADAFRRCGRPIVHMVRLYLPDGSNAELCRREALAQGKRIVAPGTDGAELIDELKPKPDTRLDTVALLGGDLQEIGRREWVMYKPRWGAFYETSLEKHLRELDVDTLVVCGCNFPNCPRASVYEASERDFKIVLATDATSQSYERGLRELEGIGVRCVESGTYLTQLAAGM